MNTETVEVGKILRYPGVCDSFPIELHQAQELLWNNRIQEAEELLKRKYSSSVDAYKENIWFAAGFAEVTSLRSFLRRSLRYPSGNTASMRPPRT